MLLIPRTRSRLPRKAGLGQSPWIISNLCSICFARCSERMRQGPPRGRSDHRFKREPAKQGCSLRVRQLCSRIELSSNWVETSYHSGLQAGSWDGYTKPSLYMDEGKRLPRRSSARALPIKPLLIKGTVKQGTVITHLPIKTFWIDCAVGRMQSVENFISARYNIVFM